MSFYYDEEDKVEVEGYGGGKGGGGREGGEGREKEE